MRPEDHDAVAGRFLRHKASVVHLALDASGRVAFANAFALAVLGPNVVGRAFADRAVSFTDAVDPVRLAGEAERAPVTFNVPGSLPRTLYCSFVADGELVHVFGETSGEEVQVLQQSLLDTNADLSNMARQLQKANAELCKLHEVKNHFLGMAAHDLRNPIGAIIAYSDFVLEEAEGLTEEQQGFLQSIKVSSQYMLELLEDLLDIAKIEAGRLDLELAETDFLALVRDNMKLNAALAEKKGIRLVLAVHERIPRLVIDRLKIEQVLNNLLSNAVKYSAPGTVVTVGLFMSGNAVTVSVRDQGQGIPEDKQDRIFQPFGRVARQGTAGERSTGLGLAIVQRIVIGHRGRIWVESRPEAGSVFYFTLPGPEPDTRPLS